MTAHIKRNNKGFTLIELLVVIGILAVLLAIVLIAINPARQFAQANDTKRRSDLNAILNAVHQYGADKRGNLAALNIQVWPQYVSNSTDTWHTDTYGASLGLCEALVPTYIAALPTDPKWGTLNGVLSNGNPVTDCSVTFNTNYIVSLTAAGTSRVAVSSSAEMDINDDGVGDGDGTFDAALDYIQILR